MRHALRTIINTEVGQRLKGPLQLAVGKAGYELTSGRTCRTEHQLSLLNRFGVATVLDVGANQGQFATGLRVAGFDGAIFSVEPMRRAYELLGRRSRGDAGWHTVMAAAGAETGQAELKVSANSTSSSLLTVTDLHRRHEPSSRIASTDMVAVRPLDALVDAVPVAPPYFLKIDVQGGELSVLDGASAVLEGTSVLRVETSFRPLYEGGASYLAVLTRLADEGFVPVALEDAFCDPATGDALQVDVTACRAELL